MKFYTKITLPENNRRLQHLGQFRRLLVIYFNNSHASWMAEERIEEKEALKARIEINRMVDMIYNIIICAGVNPNMTYTPPPAIGGYVQNIDLIHNIFNIHRFQIGPQYLFDYIDRAIGVYESNSRKALIRTFNPFHYLGLALEWVVSIPFYFLGTIGFNRRKAEESVFGRIIKGILYLITVLASALTALNYLGLLEQSKNIFKKIIGG